MKKVTIALDNQRELRYPINAMVELEERFGKALPAVFNKEQIGLTLIIALTRVGLKYGGMQFEGTFLEQEQATGELLQEHWFQEGRTLDELMGIILDAFKEAGIFAKDTFKSEEPTTNPE